MTNYNLYRGSIFHCIEDGGNVEPVYFPDGLMVVSAVSYTHLTLPTKA